MVPIGIIELAGKHGLRRKCSQGISSSHLPRLSLFCGIVLLLLTFCLGSVKAQRLSYGAGISWGIMQLPDAYVERTSWLPPTPSDTIIRPANWALTSALQFPIVIRLVHFDDDKSLMLSATPSVGFYVPTASREDYSFPFFVQAPMLLQYSQGMFSTPQTAKEHGFGVGLGLEVSWYHDRWTYGDPNNPFSRWTAFEFENRYIAAPSLLIRPTAAIFYRKWTKGNNPIEWGLHYATTRQTYDLGTVNRGFVRISLSTYLNY